MLNVSLRSVPGAEMFTEAMSRIMALTVTLSNLL